MKVTGITLCSVELTSHETYYMAEGKTCDTVKTHVLCLETDSGLQGWGEVCPIPHYLPAFANEVPSAITEMVPEILGISPFGVDAPKRRLDGFLQDHLDAKSIVDMALSTPRRALLNTSDLASYVGPRIAPDCPTRKDGRIAPPIGPEIGVTPDLDLLGTPILELV